MNSCSASEKDVRLTCFAFKIVVLRIKNPPFSQQKIWRQNGDKNLVSRFSNAEKPEFLIKKNSSNSEESEELVREAGLEPARPEWTLEPESSESANSTTRACVVFRLLRYIITCSGDCQAFSFRASAVFCSSRDAAGRIPGLFYICADRRNVSSFRRSACFSSCVQKAAPTAFCCSCQSSRSPQPY